MSTAIDKVGRFWRFPDGAIEQIGELAAGVDRVELKIVVACDSQPRTCAVLGVDLAECHDRSVYYLDTNELALERAGLILRVRSVDGAAGDSVVKLRPATAAVLADDIGDARRFLVELDMIPGAFVRSGSLKSRLGDADVERALAGVQPVRSLFSKRQRALFSAVAPAGTQIDALRVYGPVRVRRRRTVFKGLPLVVQMWTYPDGSQRLEVSTRCRAKSIVHVAAQTASVLGGCGIEPDDSQPTKTQATLAYFSGESTAAVTQSL